MPLMKWYLDNRTLRTKAYEELLEVYLVEATAVLHCPFL